MKKNLIFFVILFSFQVVFSQKTLFDSLQIDKTTKIIGRYPQYDKTKTYRKFNFILEDSVLIADFKKMIKLGQEVPNSFENPNFWLTVVKNKVEIGSWAINPTQKSAMTHDGHTYKFDLKQIEKLNEKYPFEYEHKEIVFKNKAEYDKYLAEQKKDSTFLFVYAPQFRYEGSFEIEFKKSQEFSSPKAISDFLEPYIEKIVNSNQYHVTYELNSKNMQNRNQYTMTVTGPKILFDKLKIKNLKNENWKPTLENGWFFYKK